MYSCHHVIVIFVALQVHIEYEEHGYVHIKVFDPLNSSAEFSKATLQGYEDNKKLDSPIEVF